MQFRGVRLQVVKFPLAARVNRYQLPFPGANCAVSFVFPAERITLERLPIERGHKTAAFHGRYGTAVVHGRVLHAGQFNKRRHQVDNVPRLAFERAAAGYAGRPMRDKRRGDPALVGIVLVEPEGRVAGICPARPVTVIRPRLAHSFKFRALVQDVLRTALGVEAPRVPFRTGAVVGEEDDERVIQLSIGAQVIEQTADVAVHDVHHGGENGHAPGQVPAPIGVNRVPGRVVLASPAVRCRDPIRRNHAAGRQFPALVGQA